MKIKHKIKPKTPDDVCELCQQQIDGVCRAMSLPHTKEEEIRDFQVLTDIRKAK